MKTNLDLSSALLSDLDQMVEYLGSTRQAEIKGFVLQSLDLHFRSHNQSASPPAMEISSGASGDEINTLFDGRLRIAFTK